MYSSQIICNKTPRCLFTALSRRIFGLPQLPSNLCSPLFELPETPALIVCEQGTTAHAMYLIIALQVSLQGHIGDLHFRNMSNILRNYYEASGEFLEECGFYETLLLNCDVPTSHKAVAPMPASIEKKRKDGPFKTFVFIEDDNPNSTAVKSIDGFSLQRVYR